MTPLFPSISLAFDLVVAVRRAGEQRPPGDWGSIASRPASADRRPITPPRSQAVGSGIGGGPWPVIVKVIVSPRRPYPLRPSIPDDSSDQAGRRRTPQRTCAMVRPRSLNDDRHRWYGPAVESTEFFSSSRHRSFKALRAERRVRGPRTRLPRNSPGRALRPGGRATRGRSVRGRYRIDSWILRNACGTS